MHGICGLTRLRLDEDGQVLHVTQPDGTEPLCSCIHFSSGLSRTQVGRIAGIKSWAMLVYHAILTQCNIWALSLRVESTLPTFRISLLPALAETS
jgi:hypothetical protein